MKLIITHRYIIFIKIMINFKAKRLFNNESLMSNQTKYKKLVQLCRRAKIKDLYSGIARKYILYECSNETGGPGFIRPTRLAS